MKIIINVMLLLLTEKKRENILSRSARFAEGNRRKGRRAGKREGVRGMILESNALR